MLSNPIHRRRATQIPAATNEMFIWQSPTHSVCVCIAGIYAINTCLSRLFQ
jgi:hypothetical protein